jgi:hypothetical protein
MPRLVILDVRGLTYRGWTPWCDHFLLDVAARCSRLQVLRVGAAFVRSWEPQWWAPLTELKEFVVGSRREDTEWHDGLWTPIGTAGAPPPPPFALHEDFYTMLRTLPIKTLKVWVPLAPASFTALIFPTAAFATLVHVSVNAEGNTHHRPIDEPAKEEPKETAPAKGKANAKAKQALEDVPAVPKVLFPALVTVGIADIKERPDFVGEVMIKFATTAPNVAHWNVSNTHRNGPNNIAPVVVAKVRGVRH